MEKCRRNAELINYMETELQGFREEIEAIKELDLLRARLEKVPNWKRL